MGAVLSKSLIQFSVDGQGCVPSLLFSWGQTMVDFPGGSGGKVSAYDAGDPGSIPGSGRSPGKGNGNPFQYSCLENPTDRGAWWAIVYGITKSRTQLSDFTFTLNYGGGNEDNGDLLQKVPCTTALSAPNPAAATTDPRLCWRLLDTHRQVWVSLLWGHCSFLLDPGAHNILFVPSKSLFPQSSVRSGSSRVALMATSSKRAYAIPRSATPRAPAPAAGHC